MSEESNPKPEVTPKPKVASRTFEEELKVRHLAAKEISAAGRVLILASPAVHVVGLLLGYQNKEVVVVSVCTFFIGVLAAIGGNIFKNQYKNEKKD